MKRYTVLLALGAFLVAVAAVLWVARPGTSGEGGDRLDELDRGAALASVGSPGQERAGSLPAGAPFEADASIAGESAPEEAAAAGEMSGLLERKVIETASLSLQVETVGRAFQEVGRIAAASGGFVTSSTFSNEGDEETASVTIRVPATRFQEVLASIRRLAAKVEYEQSDATDVTEEFSDLGARLRNLEATEAQYLGFLKQAKDIGEVLQVQDRLNAVRGEIERVRGRMNLLEDLTDLATVTVHLRPEQAPAAAPGPGGPDPLHAAGEAWAASLDALRGIASAIVVVAAFSWWLVPPLALLVLTVRFATSRRSRQEAGG